LPGEERPSLDSVTPYDDKPSQLIGKVDKLFEEKKGGSAKRDSYKSALDSLNKQTENLKQSAAV